MVGCVTIIIIIIIIITIIVIIKIIIVMIFIRDNPVSAISSGSKEALSLLLQITLCQRFLKEKSTSLLVS